MTVGGEEDVGAHAEIQSFRFLFCLREKQNTSTVSTFLLGGQLLLVLFLCCSRYFCKITNRFPQRCRVIFLFFYMKLGRFSFNRSAILSFCLKPLCTQGSPCLFPWQPLSSSSLASLLPSRPLRSKCRRRQRKACVASCLSLTCVGVFVITSSKVRTGRLTSDVTDAQFRRGWQTAGATNRQTLEETISFWGGGLQVLGNWLVYCKSEAGPSLRVDVIVDKIDPQTLSWEMARLVAFSLRKPSILSFHQAISLGNFIPHSKISIPFSLQSLHTITASVFWRWYYPRSFPSQCRPLTKAAYYKTAWQ